MIIDAHVHFYPAEIAKNPELWANAREEFYWAKLVGKRSDGKTSLQGFPSEKKFLDDMDAAGVERAIIQGWYWENPDTCDEFNAKIADLIKRYPDRLSAFACLQPKFFERAIETAKRAFDNGFIGVGELHDGVQNFSYLDANFESLAKFCAEKKLPICAHLTERSSREYLGKVRTNFDEAFEVAKKYPDVNFIFAHWLGGEIFESPENAKEIIARGNVYFDSAASPLLCSSDAWKVASENFENVAIYGSDYPLRLYPRKFKIEEMSTILSEAKTNIAQNSFANFFENNIKKIAKI